MSVTITEIKNCDLLRDNAEALVNTVNCVGVMGKGLALSFKRRFPEMFQQYRMASHNNEVRIGRVHLWRNPAGRPRLVLNFPTKMHWRDPSQLEWVAAGLFDLARVIRAEQLKSIAIPPLGCGLGGLQWPTVRRLINDVLQQELFDLDVDVRLYGQGL